MRNWTRASVVEAVSREQRAQGRFWGTGGGRSGSVSGTMCAVSCVPSDSPHCHRCSLQGCKDRALSPTGHWLLLGPGGSKGAPGWEGGERSVPVSLCSSPGW